MSEDDPLSLVGTTLENTYRIERMVGEGGFGVVYKGFHLAFEQPIAIKCLKIPHDFSPTMRQAFLKKFREEGRLLYQLSQGTLGIVRSIALGDTTTPSGIWSPYVVLEWLEGNPLATENARRAKQGLSGRVISEVIEMLDVPARALAHAHEQRVAHRDIKPANIFMVDPVRPGGRTVLKLLDFGIAKVMEEGASAARANATQMGFTSFTPQYAAPEQFDPSVGPTGPWTDVYAFALVMVEMLTDRPPAGGDDPIALVTLAKSPHVRPTPRTRGAAVSDAVEGVFSRALRVQPTERFPNMGEFWDALKLVAGVVVAEPTTSGMSPWAAYPMGMHGAPAASQGMPTPAGYPPAGMPYVPTPPGIQAIPSAGYTPPQMPMDPYTMQSAGMVPYDPGYDPSVYQPQVVVQQAPSGERSPWFWVPLIILILIVLVLVLSGVMCGTCVCMAAA